MIFEASNLSPELAVTNVIPALQKQVTALLADKVFITSKKKYISRRGRLSNHCLCS
jgi:hypothetical protein